jgi:hypothetical protein
LAKKKKPQIMVFITGNQGSTEIERDRDPATTHVDPLALPTLDPDRSILVRGTRPRPRIRLLCASRPHDHLILFRAALSNGNLNTSLLVFVHLCRTADLDSAP